MLCVSGLPVMYYRSLYSGPIRGWSLTVLGVSMGEEISEEGEKQKTVKFLEIPCMRTSLLYGLGGGLTAGLAAFLFTSNVRKSTNIGFFSYLFATIGTWSYCRYQWSENKMNQRKIKYALEQGILREGTDLDKQIEQNSEEV